MRIVKFCLSVFFMLNVYTVSTAQQSVTVNVYPHTTLTLGYETFDINNYKEYFSKSGSLDYVYTRADGTQIRITCQFRNQPVQVYETPPSPALYRIFKEFYPNGRLKIKGVYLPLQLRVGQWLYYGTSGNPEVVDYETVRRDFDYNKILQLLEREGYVNQQNARDNWIPAFWFNDSSRQWGVKLSKDNIERILTISASTGKIIRVEEFDLSSVPVNQISDYYIQEE